MEHRRGLGAPPLQLERVESSPGPASEPLEIALRPLRETDVAFVYSSWLKSFRGGRGIERMAGDPYYELVHGIIDQIMARRHVQLIVACEPERPDAILGWVCFEHAHIPVLHYVYVRGGEHRRRGIGRALVTAAGATGDCIYTFSHKRAARFIAGALPRGAYIPVVRYLKP